jgi:deazaflavin-dependent oxidoreductase (nitroreductase family)
MRKLLSVSVAALGLVAAAEWWRRNRRFGADFVNRVVDPWLVARGIVTTSRGEIGLLEHVGRKSAVVRRTPVHPVPTEDGFRIIVPLGEASGWARNVLAAGHCRLELDGRLVELDEPVFETPAEVPGLPRALRLLYGWLGFRYLRVRVFRDVAATSDAQPTATTASEFAGTPS